jgi:hypothetical protein
MKQKLYILGLVSSLVLITGTIFKLSHWPAAGILLSLGTFLLLAMFLPAALINHYSANGNTQNRALYIVTWLTCFVVFTAMLFKIMHWPGAGIALFIALPFPFIVFLPVWLYITSKIKNFDINNTIYILFLLVLQAVFSALLSLNVSKDKIDASLGLSLHLSSLNTIIEDLPAAGTYSSSGADISPVIRSADDLLKRIGECRQLLYDRTDITKETGNKRITGNRYLDSRSVARDVLLLTNKPTPAEKLDTSLKTFVEELGKIPGSEDLGKQASELFGLNEVNGQGISWSEKLFSDNYFSWVLISLDATENFVRVIKQEVSQ